MKISFSRLLFAFVCLLLISPVQAQVKITSALADSIVRMTLTDLSGYKLLGEICAIGPRLSGSSTAEKAIMFAKSKMETMGFDSVWLQKTMVPQWVRGAREICTMNKGKKKDNLVIASLGGSIGTPGTGLTADVIEINDFEELKLRSNEVKGKIVFYNVKFDHRMLNTFGAYGKAVRYRSNGAIEAAKYGAVGVLLRSISSRNDNVPHVGMMRYNDTIPKIPAAAIGIKDADKLSAALNKSGKISLTLVMDCKTLEDVESYNLICEIKGSAKSNEVVVVSGHYDSWDKGDGAHDDAAGCVQSLEALMVTKKLGIKPQRTLRCIFYMNEENGVRGAVTYAKYAEETAELHYAAIESDRGAFTPRGFSVDADSATIQAMQRWLPILNRSGIEWIKKGGSGVDISFIKNTNALIGYVPDDQRYFDYHHSANDVFSEVNPREFSLGSASITLLMLLLSEEGI